VQDPNCGEGSGRAPKKVEVKRNIDHDIPNENGRRNGGNKKANHKVIRRKPCQVGGGGGGEVGGCGQDRPIRKKRTSSRHRPALKLRRFLQNRRARKESFDGCQRRDPRKEKNPSLFGWNKKTSSASGVASYSKKGSFANIKGPD